MTVIDGPITNVYWNYYERPWFVRLIPCWVLALENGAFCRHSSRFCVSIARTVCPSFHCQNKSQVTQGRSELALHCQTMMGSYRSVHPLQGILADNSFCEQRSCWKLLNVNQISSINDTLCCCKYLYIFVDYTCNVMHFNLFKYIIYNGSLYFVIDNFIAFTLTILWFRVKSE